MRPSNSSSIHIITSFSDSIVSFRGSLIQHILGLGHPVSVWAPDFSRKTLHQLHSYGAHTFTYPISRSGLSLFNDIYSCFYLYRQFLKFKPSVVFTNFTKPNIWAILASFFARTPRKVALVEGLGYFFTPNSLGHFPLNKLIICSVILFLYNISFLAADHVLVLNKDDLLLLRKYCIFSRHKISLLGPIGLDIHEWQFSQRSISPFTFIMVSRILAEKGVYEYLKASSIVSSSFPEARFLLLGSFDSSNPGSISHESFSLSLQDSPVEWLGHTDVIKLLSQSSVFVLPSYREGFPRSTQEAMALGLPVITTDVAGCRETVIHGKNGLLVSPRDVHSLAAAMLFFLHDTKLVSQYGAQSRQYAEQRFDVNYVNKKLVSILLPHSHFY